MAPTLLLLVSLAALPDAAWSQTGQESLSAVPTEASKAHIGPASSSVSVAVALHRVPEGWLGHRAVAQGLLIIF